MQDLKSFDSELLLREIQARESIAKDISEKTLPCARGPFAKVGVVNTVDPVPELKDYETSKIMAVLHDRQKVIYGTDDRQDMYLITDSHILTDADSVVALIKVADITDNGDGTSTLNGSNFGASRNLCQTEPFHDQPTIAFCTGFLVDPIIIATAAHCVDANSLSSIRFVFGFEMSSATTAETRINNNEIYRGIRILGRQIGTAGTDWALVQLDRPVINHSYVRVRRTGKVDDNAAVHVIGHPAGLPKKYAGGAVVRDNTAERYFVANTDTYGGNSGSPVFNSITHLLEGILVRGENDFIQSGNCFVSNICPVSGCRGEDCTRTTEFASLVPRNEHDFIPFDPNQAQVVNIGNRWKIVVGYMRLKDFGDSEKEAHLAFDIIKHYAMNTQCFVGRPYPSMEFYLVNGAAPEGQFPGEDVIQFNSADIEAQRVGGRWKLIEGTSHWLMDFDQQEEEARQALSYILRYDFNYIGFVGRPNPSMVYFRK